MKAIDKINTVELFQELGNREFTNRPNAVNDDGLNGKLLEMTLKIFKASGNKTSWTVTPSNRSYGDTTYSNKRLGISRARLEIKSACGELGEGNIIDLTRILPRADYVVYCPEIDERLPLESQSFVFTRAEFLEIITSYKGKGQVIRTKRSTKGKWLLSFQSFFSEGRPTSSKKLANHIWDCCYAKPTFQEWLQR